ncbi:MAG TPA: aminopeptidase P family N-terminal domain-containing protein [Chloroflexota bacterium]|nr:aminopeptidase P family N-terminal domain-containing protein [Chloroflexota bacterium]
MKRGLIEWDPSELPAATLAGRVARVRSVLAERGLDAAVFYTSVAQPGIVRYLTHFLPYWNEGLLVLPREGEPTLFVALSNRVFPWIKGSSTLQDVRASRNLGVDAARLLAERGAARVGLGDSGSIPYRVIEELRSNLADGQVVDAPELAARLCLGADADELRLRGHAGRIAADALAALGPNVAGRTDSAVAGQLDGAMRLNRAEDTLVLVGPAGRWPGLPTGITLGERAHVVVQVEYKGHWVLTGRTLGASADAAAAWQARLATLAAPGRAVGALAAEARAHDGTEVYVYRSGRGAPFTALDERDALVAGDVAAVLAYRAADGDDLYGATFAVEPAGPRPI